MASLERNQILLYLLATGLGLLICVTLPQLGGSLTQLLCPALGLLLYATFVQVPLGELRPALSWAGATAAGPSPSRRSVCCCRPSPCRST